MRDQRALSSASVAERYLVAASHMPLPLPHPFGGCSPRTTVKTPCRYRAGMLFVKVRSNHYRAVKGPRFDEIEIGFGLSTYRQNIASGRLRLARNAPENCTSNAWPARERADVCNRSLRRALAVRRHCRAEARDGAAFRLPVWCWRDRSGRSRDRPLAATWHCKHRCFAVWSLSS
jgi:hypothetical protein